MICWRTMRRRRGGTEMGTHDLLVVLTILVALILIVDVVHAVR